MPDPLAAFSPPVRDWFRATFGRPTPPQAEGWPAIQRGEHALILAPTGSGKTLAAFLWGLDELYRELSQAEDEPEAGVRLLYVSPLKALNNDIERNLRVPLEGIRAVAERRHLDLPALHVAVRTGDTPQALRAQMLRRPPHILITTPESLYLLLTSPRARDMLRTVRSVIVDEIHTLVGNKRGAHLALSLERLVGLSGQAIQRIGLSATIRPLDEAARFLGGQTFEAGELVSRPVTIVNAHYRKPLDLQVVTAVDDFRDLPATSIWPSVVPRVLDDIRRHHTTLIFANNRRLAERTADRLNAQLEAEQSEEIPPGSTEALAPGGLARDRGIFAIGAHGPIRAHHGSMSKESRRQMEEDLKAGKLPALVGTSSLELGIDIGAVDVVVQLQSPKSVAQGLQRVGRSGHLVGQTSKGRIYATFREDLVEAAAIARGMLDGDVEPTYTPRSPLDVLAQQIVAMVAMEDWPPDRLYALLRQAYPYAGLTWTDFVSVLDMLTGKYYLDLPSGVKGPAQALRPKIAWDRVQDRLTALPGSRLAAMSNAGTIPDTGAYGVYLGDGKTRLGELDEEFVFETRVGDAFLLGSNVWRVTEIGDDRVVVADAAGATPRMPFWNGDYPYRPYELGARIGRFRRAVVERVRQASPAEVEAWLRREYALDESSARNLSEHVKRQLDAVGVISSDQTIVVESFQNAAGDSYLVVHSPFGGRVNGAWALALMSAWREQIGVTPEAQTSDDGLIFRFPPSERQLPADVIRRMTPQEARERLLQELPHSAVFGARFRMNAGRALLLPRARAGKRMPFWLQRLRAKDLLAFVRGRRLDDFPILVETTRDCLQDVFDLPHLEEVLTRIQAGDLQVVPIETAVPSPVAASLLYNFVGVYLYEWDAPKAERQLQTLSLTGALSGRTEDGAEPEFPGGDLSGLLRPEAIAEVEARAAHRAPGYQARTLEELALVLRELGDLTDEEVAAATSGDQALDWLRTLEAQGRAVPLIIGGQQRWVPAELADDYRSAFSLPPGLGVPGRGVQLNAPTTNALPPDGGIDQRPMGILQRFLGRSGPVTRAGLLSRYPFAPDWLDAALEQLVEARAVLRGRFTDPDRVEFIAAPALDQIRRRTLTLLRQEVQPVSLYAYAAFLARWQHVQPEARLAGPAGLRQVLEQMRGIALPLLVWEREALPARLQAYDPADLEALAQGGQMVWTGLPSSASRDPRRTRLRFFFRGEGALFLEPPEPAEAGLGPEARAVYDYLKAEGASFAGDLREAAGLRLSPDALRAALIELVIAGLATNDTLDALRALGAEAAKADEQAGRPALSPLEAELKARLGPRQRPLTTSRYRAAKARVQAKIKAQLEAKAVARAAVPPDPGGRWSLVRRAAVLGPARSQDDLAEQVARVLLARYGVVTRDSLEREALPWDWSQLYPVFQRLELRGEVRRGYFVTGLPGAQFALPGALEQLRAAPDEVVLVLNAADPAQVFGGEFPEVETPRFARVPSTQVALAQGQPVVVFEENGESITALPGVEPQVVQRAVQAYLARPSAQRRITVSRWNGAPIFGSPGQPLLQALGFQNTPSAMEWWAPTGV